MTFHLPTISQNLYLRQGISILGRCRQADYASKGQSKVVEDCLGRMRAQKVPWKRIYFFKSQDVDKRVMSITRNGYF